MRGSSDVSINSSSLFAFKPRQVLLLEQQNRNLAVSAPMKNASPENPVQLTPEDEYILASSVALWLKNKGYSKVLKRFISAAQIQDDTWKAKALNLKDIFSRYQQSCIALDQVKSQKKQEEQSDGTKETNGDANSTASEKIGTKNKKRKVRGDATIGESGRTFEGTAINGKTNESKDDLSHKDEKSKSSKEFKDDEVFEFKADQMTKKQKDKKKKKKSKLNSESLGADEKQIDVIPEVTEEVRHTEITKDKKSKKRSAEAAENVIDESKKASKKRKRMPADENKKQSGEEAAVEESKSKKSKGLEEVKDAGANGHASELTNEGAINNGMDKSSQQKSARRQGDISAETKTVNVFQRVKVDEVEFVDERLQDNSYWAKGGAEIGYGAKAQEVLGQVRGRDFRHEKTKKKRGSYRGGQIDLQSHSVKFNYSDED